MKHIDIANVKMASFEIGKTVGLVVNHLQKKAEDNHLSEKVSALKAEAKDKYNKETGRNASVDGTILKYTAVATAGAITLTSMPAVLIGTAAATAAIGIASKAISISYYNRFRYNLDGPESAKNYQIANTSQKVFVVSSALYAGLALVDFTWTFSLGVKSKHYQHQANKELRLMHKQNLWL